MVELAPPDAPADLTYALIAACTRAIDGARCALISAGPEEATPYAIAIVSWQGADQLRVRIEVGIRTTERTQWLSRGMSFRAEDDPQERWKAAGLTIATLVGEVAHATAPPSADPAEPLPSVAESRRRTPSGAIAGKPVEAGGPRFQGESAIRFGPGLESGSHRLGAVLAVGYLPRRFPVQPWLCAGYATQIGASAPVAVSWTTFGVGATIEPLTLGDVAMRVRSEAFGVRTTAEATSDLDGQAAFGASWKTGWLLGVDAVWPARGDFAWTAGLEGWTTSGRVNVRWNERTVGTESLFGWAARTGVRLRLP